MLSLRTQQATVFYYISKNDRVRLFFGLLTFNGEKQNWTSPLPEKGITLPLYQD